jgi:RNA polymerase sigma factor (sigma-70 family)
MSLEIFEEALAQLERLFGLDLNEYYNDLLDALQAGADEEEEDPDRHEINETKMSDTRKMMLKELSNIPIIAARIDRVLGDFQRQIDEQAYDYCYYRSEEPIEQQLLEVMFEVQSIWELTPRKLVENNYHLVKKVAATYHQKKVIDDELAFTDLVSAAEEALFSAANRMHGKPKKDFRSFAWKVMKEKLEDEKTAHHPVPLKTRKKIEHLALLREHYELHGQTDEQKLQLAQYMGTTVDEINALMEIEALWGIGIIVDTGGNLEELEVADLSPDALSLLISIETSEKLREALDELPALQRKVIDHIYFKDMSLREAAASLNLSLNTIKKNHHRAMSFLKRLAG